MKIQNQNILKAQDYKPKANHNGFIALITLLIILSIILTTGLSISFLSVEEANMSLQKSRSSQAYYLANLCAEGALIQLKETNGAYTGETKPNIEGGNCEISVVGNWTIKVKANFQNQTRKIMVVASQINPKMIISSWREAADF
jgi:hypothetical protein